MPVLRSNVVFSDLIVSCCLAVCNLVGAVENSLNSLHKCVKINLDCRFWHSLAKTRFTDAGNTGGILSVVTSLKSSLVELIEPDFGLLDELLRLRVLDRLQVARVRSKGTVFDTNDALLDYLTSDDQCVRFISALRRTAQQHVANFVEQRGGQKHSEM